MEQPLILKVEEQQYDDSLTSLDWNETNLNIIGTSCSNSKCYLWDITQQQVIKTIFVHEQEVLDFEFNGPNNFATVSADGTLRTHDLRVFFFFFF